MKPLTSENRVVKNIQTADRQPFVNSDGSLEPGASVLQLDDTRRVGTGLHIYRMEPGAASTPHVHNSDEWFYVIEGELIEHDGSRYGPRRPGAAARRQRTHARTHRTAAPWWSTSTGWKTRFRGPSQLARVIPENANGVYPGSPSQGVTCGSEIPDSRLRRLPG